MNFSHDKNLLSFSLRQITPFSFANNPAIFRGSPVPAESVLDWLRLVGSILFLEEEENRLETVKGGTGVGVLQNNHQISSRFISKFTHLATREVTTDAFCDLFLPFIDLWYTCL